MGQATLGVLDLPLPEPEWGFWGGMPAASLVWANVLFQTVTQL
jgi:hypothetical protein